MIYRVGDQKTGRLLAKAEQAPKDGYKLRPHCDAGLN